MKKRFLLSVTEFAIPSPLVGSIDTYSGFSEGKNWEINFIKKYKLNAKINILHIFQKFQLDKNLNIKTISLMCEDV